MPLRQYLPYLLPAIAIALSLWFIAAVLHGSFYADLGFDSAYHAAVAKLFAQTGVWASPYDRAFIFNPDVTSGPTLLLPAALLMAVIGNPLWAPALAAALMHLLVIFAILYRLRHYLTDPQRYSLLVISVLIVLVAYEHSWMLLLKADYLAACLIVLAVLILFDPTLGESRTRWVLSGLTLALALQAKWLVFFIVPVLAMLAVYAVWRRLLSWRVLALFVVVVMLGLLPWKLHETFAVGTLSEAQQQERADYQRHFLLAQGSGIAEWQASNDVMAHMQKNAVRNMGHWLKHHQKRYGLPAVLMGLWVLSLVALLIYLLLKRPGDALAKVALVLVATALLHFAWFFLISASWNAKYALTANVLGLFAQLLMLARFRGLGVLTPVLLLAIGYLPPATQAYVTQQFTFSQQHTAYTDDLQALLAYLQNDHPKALTLAGCGWVFAPWVAEYALPQSNNFQDCRRLVNEAFVPQASGEYRLQETLDFAVVLNHVYWQTSSYRQRYQWVLQACGNEVLFQRDYFSVLRCPADKLQRLPAVWLRNTVATPYYYVHKPEALPLR